MGLSNMKWINIFYLVDNQICQRFISQILRTHFYIYLLAGIGAFFSGNEYELSLILICTHFTYRDMVKYAISCQDKTIGLEVVKGVSKVQWGFPKFFRVNQQGQALKMVEFFRGIPQGQAKIEREQRPFQVLCKR